MHLVLRHLFFFALIAVSEVGIGQGKSEPSEGIISGNILGEKQEAVSGATVQLTHSTDSGFSRETVADRAGNFSFYHLPYGIYRLQVTAIGYGVFILDSIHVREGRTEFVLPDIQLNLQSGKLQEVVVFAEKPLIQSRDGNITFNAAASPLSAGSTAGDLMKGLPLVAIDPDGKISVRGKEPRILIDEKPVELNAQQLQDFLESLPGSMIERIEVMTNPPPQYANEPGGVINIVTRKGRVGRSGRLQVYAGTRGESGVNGNFNYRKKTFSLNLQAGYGYSLYEGNGYSRRKNMFVDSVNYLYVDNNYANRSRRPSLRLQMDGEANSRNLFNLVLQYNENIPINRSSIRFAQLDQALDTFQFSRREVVFDGLNQNSTAQFTYTHKGQQPGVQLRVFLNANHSDSRNARDFTQRFFDPADMVPTGLDSFQQQITDNSSSGWSLRYMYERAFPNKKTFLTNGAYYSYSRSRNRLQSLGFDRSSGEFTAIDLLSNDFLFHQRILNLRFSLKQMLGEFTSISGGFNAEQTDVHFDLYHIKQTAGNAYANFMPFFNFSHEWTDLLRLTLWYRRTVRRPGIGELNPSIDFTDPFNLRFGNTELKPTLSHNFDLIFARNKEHYHLNFGLGYNIVQNIFTQIRELQPDGKTFVSWQNIDDRIEYEVSTWNGYTFSEKLRLNANITYTYNRYSLSDRIKLRYRNGASFTSGLTSAWNPTDRWSVNGGFTFNRFASPQGFVRWNTSMNLAVQRKLFSRRLVLTATVIDPIQQQINRTQTNGVNFTHTSYSLSRTRNYRLTVAYQFMPSSKKATSDAETERRRIMKMAPKKGN